LVCVDLNPREWHDIGTHTHTHTHTHTLIFYNIGMKASNVTLFI